MLTLHMHVDPQNVSCCLFSVFHDPKKVIIFVPYSSPASAKAYWVHAQDVRFSLDPVRLTNKLMRHAFEKVTCIFWIGIQLFNYW